MLLGPVRSAVSTLKPALVAGFVFFCVALVLRFPHFTQFFYIYYFLYVYRFYLFQFPLIFTILSLLLLVT